MIRPPLALALALPCALALAGPLPSPASARLEGSALRASASPSGSSAALRLERSAGSERRTSIAPLAGSRSGPSWDLASLSAREGRIEIEHRFAEGDLSGSWTTAWEWPAGSPRPRLAWARRALALPGGEILSDIADWSSGERLRMANGRLARCPMPSGEPPEFSELSLASLASGAYLPACAPGAEIQSAPAEAPSAP